VKSGTSDTRTVGSLVGPSLKFPIENDPANVFKSVVKRYSAVAGQKEALGGIN
jgi:hypothetical protein